MIKNPIWQEATTYLFTMKKQIQNQVWMRFELGTTAWKPNALTTGPKLNDLNLSQGLYYLQVLRFSPYSIHS